MGKSAQDEAVADLLSLMRQLTLDEQEKLFIGSDTASFTTNDLCEWMDVESNINVIKGMVEDAMEDSKNVLRSVTEMRMMMENTFSLPTSHRPLQSVRCCMKRSIYAINVIPDCGFIFTTRKKGD